MIAGVTLSTSFSSASKAGPATVWTTQKRARRRQSSNKSSTGISVISIKAFGYSALPEANLGSSNEPMVIKSLDDPDLTILMPIPVKLSWPNEDECIAEFVEAGIAMAGEDERDAFLALSDQIADSYHLYNDDIALGQELRRRREVMEKYIAKARR